MASSLILPALGIDDADLAWQKRALCAQTDPESFFPEKGGSTREAKKVCLSCEVRAECLDYALDHDEKWGVWGGLSEFERRKMNGRWTHQPGVCDTCGGHTSRENITRCRPCCEQITTPDHLADITARYTAGESTTTIAADYGIGHMVINRLLRSQGVRIRTRSETAALRHAQERAS